MMPVIANLLIGLSILALVLLAGRSLWRDRKKGGCSCGGSCEGCPGHCHDSPHPAGRPE